MIKAVLIDFDGTVVREDLLSLTCDLVGRRGDSVRLNREYMAGIRKGLDPLVERINFLQGLDVKHIYKMLDENDYLMKGAEEFFDFLKKKRIVSILNSGNLMSTLDFYREKLKINHIIGSRPRMDGDIIMGISEEDYSGHNFKLDDCLGILEKRGIAADEVVAIGDSPADKSIFQFAAISIAINPRNGIENYANYVIYDDLSQAIPIIKELNSRISNQLR